MRFPVTQNILCLLKAIYHKGLIEGTLKLRRPGLPKADLFNT